MIFRGVTDIESNEVIEQEMLKFQGKEISNNIELVSSYENPGYVELRLNSNYSFSFSDQGGGYPRTNMEIGYQGNSQDIGIAVELEDTNKAGGMHQEFQRRVICIIEDYPYLSPFTNTFDPDGGMTGDDIRAQVLPGECP